MMIRSLLLVALSLAAASALPASKERIVGGGAALITDFRFAAGLMYSRIGAGTFGLACGGTIINNRAILTAAQCLYHDTASQWRVRVGSVRISTGVQYRVSRLILHSSFNINTYDNDIAIVHTATAIVAGANVAPGPIANPFHHIPDGATLWVIGWGLMRTDGEPSDALLRVQVNAVNHNVCEKRYATIGRSVTGNMFCSGILDIGGRDACLGDIGGPVLHSSFGVGGALTVVGITGWAKGCALPNFPRVNTRVSLYTSWIMENA